MTFESIMQRSSVATDSRYGHQQLRCAQQPYDVDESAETADTAAIIFELAI
jgi:hypothetical protein